VLLLRRKNPDNLCPGKLRFSAEDSGFEISASFWRCSLKMDLHRSQSRELSWVSRIFGELLLVYSCGSQGWCEVTKGGLLKVSMFPYL
jgi:hypothetical protein